MSFPTVKGERVDEFDFADRKPGQYRLDFGAGGRVVGISFWCPCGCGELGGVSFGPGKWEWNGDQDRPVVSPSIFFERGKPGEWHGYLKFGVFEGCAR